MRPSPPRILLVEFLSNCPCVHYPNYAYPFLQSYFKQAGIPVRWVSLPRTDGSTVELHEVDLPPQDLELLFTEIRRFKPGMVVLNQRVTQTVGDAIKACAQGLEIRVFGESLQAVVSAEELLAAMDLPVEEGASISFLDLVPDYDSCLLNPGGMLVLPPVTVVPGVPCRYARPISGNSAFLNVDLDSVAQRVGCTFCVDHAGRGHAIRPEEAYRVAWTILERYLETAPTEPREAMFELVDSAVFPAILRDLAETESCRDGMEPAPVVTTTTFDASSGTETELPESTPPGTETARSPTANTASTTADNPVSRRWDSDPT